MINDYKNNKHKHKNNTLFNNLHRIFIGKNMKVIKTFSLNAKIKTFSQLKYTILQLFHLRQFAKISSI